jgi:dihydroxyacetone kinase
MAFTRDTLADAIARANAGMATLTDVLNAADAKLGDGDTGTMLARLIGAFAAADLRGAPDLGTAFVTLAKAGATSTGSSLGTLVITAMMTAGKATAGRTEVPWSDLAPIFETVRDAAMARGKAELGAKTIIDGLDALTTGIAGATDAGSVATAARGAMDRVLEEFRQRPSTMGRARMFAEKSIGLDDPGMLALAEIVRIVSTRPQHSASPLT